MMALSRQQGTAAERSGQCYRVDECRGPNLAPDPTNGLRDMSDRQDANVIGTVPRDFCVLMTSTQTTHRS